MTLGLTGEIHFDSHSLKIALCDVVEIPANERSEWKLDVTFSGDQPNAKLVRKAVSVTQHEANRVASAFSHAGSETSE